MSSSLSLTESISNSASSTLTPEQQSAQAGRVKKMGITALLLLLTTFIPVLGIFGLIASLVISRKALRISRENLLPIETEKPAYWASIISTLLLILFAVGLVVTLL